MGHRKVDSPGSIPFSWEDSPGVSKVITHSHHHNNNVHDYETPPCSIIKKASSIPPPPCPSLLMQQPPRRSRSAKGFGRLWQLEDPFLAAYKECTKRTSTTAHAGDPDHKTSSKKSFKSMKSNLVFSCKTTSSCDVRNDNLVRLIDLPPLPRDRIYSCVKMRGIN
ncbi:hypothetical protein HS088_TW05G00004 [Tripterygium wilfordii]|uniref:Uncharacterized protein n=1 Tax=Tripterygium wilfordii TaxID=458696 RepID=A0A7J7DM33_TRIWF|nr:hypothetical protein HS088_TW05G00004 [Tripterygium wilfordii]